MQRALVLAAATVLLAFSGAEGATVKLPTFAAMPDGATARYARFVPRLTSAGRLWVQTESVRLRDGQLEPAGLSDEAAEACAMAVAGCAHVDIMALTEIVMLQAMADSADDLRDAVAELKAANSQKPVMRGFRQTIDKAAVDTAKDVVKDKLNSMSEMGEMESLHLQMAMDRLSRLMTTLANIEKKNGDADSSITSDIK